MQNHQVMHDGPIPEPTLGEQPSLYASTSSAVIASSGIGLALCALAGLARVGVVAIDGTTVMPTPAATPRSITSRSRARSSKEAKAVDAAEDERFGEARGEEPPPELSTQ